ncbi:TolC family protein [Candidatus Poribacteria bacterium]|nr:TolC family protein [Candidatus Poribacteria bacterium]
MRKIPAMYNRLLSLCRRACAALSFALLSLPFASFFLLTTGVAIAEPLQAEVGTGRAALPLSLEDCISVAMKNNLDIGVENYVPAISDADVQTQKGLFDPHIFFNATYINRVDPLSANVSVSAGGLTSVKTEQWLLSGGLTGAIATGLAYEASISSEHTPFSTITDFFEANGEQRFTTALTVTQPLLKNFGVDVNTTGIRAAEKTREASVYELELTILTTLFDVESAYWELVFARENLQAKMRSLELAQNLLDENRIRLEVGVIPPLAVLQSETGVAVREEEVIVARSQVEDAEDQLIRVTNLLPDKFIWDLEIVPTDSPVVLPPQEYVEGREITAALTKRPELKQLLKQQEAAELNVRFTKNQLLPALDLNASIGLMGLDDGFDSSVFSLASLGLPLPPPPHKGIDPATDDLFSGDHLQWVLGFTFELPWGTHFERGQYKSANLQVSQIDASIRNLRQVIIQDARNALRGVGTNWERVQATRDITQFRRESLLAEKKKFEVGVSTAHDVLQFEDELAAAEADELRATVDYVLSQTNLLRATGTLLEARNVRLAVNP